MRNQKLNIFIKKKLKRLKKIDLFQLVIKTKKKHLMKRKQRKKWFILISFFPVFFKRNKIIQNLFQHQYANSVWDQIVVLTRRSIKNLQRNRSVLKGLAFNIAGFFFLGIVFLGLLVNFSKNLFLYKKFYFIF